MSSFISFPFKLPWGYWILRNLDDNYLCPPKKKLGQQPDWPTSVWTTGVPQKDSAVPSPHNYLVNCGYNHAHCGAPSPTNLLQLSYLIFGDGFVAYIYVIYTHKFSLTPLLFLLCPISIHLSIRKLSLQAQWLPDVFMWRLFQRSGTYLWSTV